MALWGKSRVFGIDFDNFGGEHSAEGKFGEGIVMPEVRLRGRLVKGGEPCFDGWKIDIEGGGGGKARLFLIDFRVGRLAIWAIR